MGNRMIIAVVTIPIQLSQKLRSKPINQRKEANRNPVYKLSRFFYNRINLLYLLYMDIFIYND